MFVNQGETTCFNSAISLIRICSLFNLQKQTTPPIHYYFITICYYCFCPLIGLLLTYCLVFPPLKVIVTKVKLKQKDENLQKEGLPRRCSDLFRFLSFKSKIRPLLWWISILNDPK